MTVVEMFSWQSEQRYRLRSGRRAYSGPAYRDDGACPEPNRHRRAHLSGGSVVSLSLDGIAFGRG
jgi:hypothetical protein